MDINDTIASVLIYMYSISTALLIMLQIVELAFMKHSKCCHVVRVLALRLIYGFSLRKQRDLEKAELNEVNVYTNEKMGLKIRPTAICRAHGLTFAIIQLILSLVFIFVFQMFFNMNDNGFIELCKESYKCIVYDNTQFKESLKCSAVSKVINLFFDACPVYDKRFFGDRRFLCYKFGVASLYEFIQNFLCAFVCLFAMFLIIRLSPFDVKFIKKCPFLATIYNFLCFLILTIALLYGLILLFIPFNNFFTWFSYDVQNVNEYVAYAIFHAKYHIEIKTYSLILSYLTILCELIFINERISDISEDIDCTECSFKCEFSSLIF